jgi:large subunit ribosomal protein L29
MATTTAAEMRHLDNDSLEEQLREFKEELFNLRFQAATGQLESHGRLRHVRRDIARIYTIMRERELGIIAMVSDDADDVDAADDTDTADTADTQEAADTADPTASSDSTSDDKGAV